MKKYLLIAITLVISGVGKAQINIVWQKGYGTSQTDSFLKSIEVSDGYLHFGKSDANIEGDKTEMSYGGDDIWIVKTDFVGNILWDKTIGGSGSEGTGNVIRVGNIIYLLSSSNSIISGLKTSIAYGGSDYWLIALDLNANILWQQSYGGTGDDGASSIEELNNAQLLICGTSKSNVSGNKTLPSYDAGGDFWPIIVDKNNGNLIRQNVVGTNATNVGKAIVVNDNSIFILGQASVLANYDQSFPSYGGSDAWLINIDSNLNIVNDKCFGGSDAETISNLAFDGTNIYLLTSSQSNISGNKTSPQQGLIDPFSNPDLWLIKIDQNMNILWDKTYGGSDSEFAYDLKFINSKLIIGLLSFSGISGNKTVLNFGTGADIWLLILNNDGSVFDQKAYGGSAFDQIGKILVNTLGNILITSPSTIGISGNHLVPNYGLTDAWVFELSTAFLSVVENQSIVTEVFPNPFSETIQFNLTATNQQAVIEIYTMDGKLCKQERYAAGTQSVSFQLPELGNLFIYKIVSGTNAATGKLVRR